jgi:hypothetical protein
MIKTILNRFFVAEYYSSPRGDSKLHEWKLCRDSYGAPRHWGDRAGAEGWIDNECDGSRSKTNEYMIIEKEVSFSHSDPATVLDIHSLLVVLADFEEKNITGR